MQRAIGKHRVGRMVYEKSTQRYQQENKKKEEKEIYRGHDSARVNIENAEKPHYIVYPHIHFTENL